MTVKAVAANRSAGENSDALCRKSAGTASGLSILHAVRGVFWAGEEPVMMNRSDKP